MDQRFVDAWADGLRGAADLAPGFPVTQAARVSQAIVYGLPEHAHLARPGTPDHQRLRTEACLAVTACLQQLTTAAAKPRD